MASKELCLSICSQSLGAGVGDRRLDVADHDEGGRHESDAEEEAGRVKEAQVMQSVLGRHRGLGGPADAQHSAKTA